MLQVINSIGRLVEVRAAAPVAMEDLHRFDHQLDGWWKALGQEMILCADASRMRILSARAADLLVQIFDGRPARIGRAAFLLPPDDPLVTMQLQRLSREVADGRLGTFRDRLAMESWLGDGLLVTEREKLGDFLRACPA